MGSEREIETLAIQIRAPFRVLETVQTSGEKRRLFDTFLCGSLRLLQRMFWLFFGFWQGMSLPSDRAASRIYSYEGRGR